MKNRNTKQRIADTALEMFSVQGFEATSVSQIADKVGIKKATVYSHFKSKEEILKSILREGLAQYEWHSVFSETNRNNFSFFKDKEDLNALTITEMIVGQIRYILHEPSVAKARKMLTIEQFRNPMLANLQTKQNYSDVMKYFIGLMNFLIAEGKLVNKDSEIMAAQLCLPVSVWINLCDREPEREDEIIELVRRHIRQFFEMYRANDGKE